MANCNAGGYSTDWCQADAMRDSLREHMALLKAANEKIQKLEQQRVDEIVVGDRRVSDGDAEGTILTLENWDKQIIEKGLSGKWLQIIIRPVADKTKGD